MENPDDLRRIDTAPPPEFDGPGRTWSSGLLVTGRAIPGNCWRSACGALLGRQPSLRALRSLPSTERLGVAGWRHPKSCRSAKTRLERQLTVFRSGARVDTAMQIVAAHSTLSSPQHIAALATYLSRLDANPNPVEGSGEHRRVGQELSAHICAACHGVNGRGEPVDRVPRIAGQHYPYLRRQIEAAAALHKELAPPEMTSALRGMRPQEKDALADYISRLGDSEALLDSNRP
jgi:cytochrome c553